MKWFWDKEKMSKEELQNWFKIMFFGMILFGVLFWISGLFNNINWLIQTGVLFICCLITCWNVKNSYIATYMTEKKAPVTINLSIPAPQVGRNKKVVKK